jgi:dihydrofolate synthase/folylpolyglutamate synthase
MNYSNAVRYLLALGGELAAPRQPAPVAKFDLRNITTLAAKLGNPHRAVPCAHIAGTNGKGSTAAMLESILRHAGLRTGLYTSPHLERINERIAVNGQPISDADFAAAFTRVHHAIEELLASGALTAHPTFFECVTAMAFDHFARCAPLKGCHPERSEGSAFPFESTTRNADSSPASGLGMTSKEAGAGGKAGVDFAVYEVGMGGRLDSTNIVTPEVCVITQIDFDHENYLGHSIEQIAAEKAGILKPGAPVVCAAGRPEARAVIARRAAELKAQLIDIDEPAGAASLPVRLEPSLSGRFQKRNAITAAMAARELRQRGFLISDEAVARGIAQTRWPGRLELIAHNPDVYLDGTHNPAGARELLAFWDEHLAGRRIFLIFGAVRDKAVEEITGLLFPRAAHVICTQPRSARAISAQRLAEITAHDANHMEVMAEPEAALARALELARPEDVVFATGSLYLVGDLRRWWRTQHPSVIPSEAAHRRA